MNFCISIPFRKVTFQLCVEEISRGEIKKADLTRTAQRQAIYRQIERERSCIHEEFSLLPR